MENTQNTSELVSNLVSVIERMFFKEIEEYNNDIRQSEAWSQRRTELLNGDHLVLGELQKEIDRINKIYDSDFAIDTYSINDYIESLLTKEFELIDTDNINYRSKYGRWSVNALISSKLLTQNITDVDATIGSTIEWLKEKFEIYI